ncbi:MAG TPA: BON domain-containing protein [Gemmatimonadales bacterium]|jgi:osmotically-inducible protein OsmY|nr:BON domain-containing protein [Gemmatimonadales bacterium]
MDRDNYDDYGWRGQQRGPEQSQRGWSQGRPGYEGRYGRGGYGSQGGYGPGRYGQGFQGGYSPSSYGQPRSGQTGGWQGREGQGMYGGYGQGGYGQGRVAWPEERENQFRESEPGRGPSGEQEKQRGQFAGRGPKGYKRSDDRIREDVNEALTRNPDIDASDIEVKVESGEVTLTGTVDSRQTKRLAEDLAEDCSGVHEVHNQLRIKHPQSGNAAEGGEARPRSGRATSTASS